MSLPESLKGAYAALEERYYAFAEGVQQSGIPMMEWFVKPIEGRGIPSMPVFAIIVLLLAAAAAGILLVAQGQGGPQALTVVVQGDGTPVENARVQLLFGSTIISEQLVKNGRAVFENLPSGALSVKVQKEGYPTATRALKEGQTTLRISLSSGAGGTGTQADDSELTLEVLDAKTREPVEGAQIIYVSETASGTGTTGADGLATLPKMPLAKISIKKDGYDVEQMTARGGGRLTAYLSRFGTPAIGGGGTITDLSSEGIVNVFVSGKSGPLAAKVKLYNTDGLLESEGETAEGMALLNAPIGDSVYPIIQADGYPLYDGAATPQVVSETTEFRINLETGKASGAAQALDTTIRAQDAKANALTFKAKIIKPPLIELAEYEGDSWVIPVSPGTYYVWGKAAGYISKTLDLMVGKENVLVMEKATPFNTGSLEVAVQDEYGNAIGGARVLLLKDGRPASDTLAADADGKAAFTEAALGAVEVRAQAGHFVGTQNATIEQGGGKTTVTVSIHRGTVSVNVTNAVDGRPAEAVMEVQSLGKLSAQKRAAYATLEVPSLVEAVVNVRADGFLPYSASVILADGEDKKLDAALLPESAARGTKIDLMAVRATNGKQVTAVQPGNEYILEINATPAAQSSEQAIYVRIGGEGTAEEDNAMMTEFSAANKVIKSISYTPSTDCKDLNANLISSPDGYKWVELQFDAPAVRVLSFVFKVKPAAKANQPLSIYFATRTKAGNVVARDPPDDSNPGCYPKAYEYKIGIAAGQAVATPTPAPTTAPGTTNTLPTGSYFTPSVGITYNAATGKIEADVKEIVLQIDAIYPRDSVQLRIADDKCKINLKVESQSENTCFKVDRTALVFETKDYVTSCPSYVKGNKVMMANGTASLVMQATCGGIESLTTLPIKINAQEAQSITGAPQQLDGGEGTSKIMYVVNQKQSGARTLTPLGANGEVGVNPHSTTAIAWGGPGTLTLLEGDQSVAEWTYTTAPAYFKGIGTVGTRVDSASDYMSCAQGWCTGKAMLQAVQAFKQEAQKTAAATRFRRGTGTNAAAGEPFVFTTVAQAGENADKALEASGFTVKRDSSCTPGKPAAFELRAESSDGNSFKLSASTIMLGNNLDNPSNKMALCNFLYVQGKAIKAAGGSSGGTGGSGSTGGQGDKKGADIPFPALAQLAQGFMPQTSYEQFSSVKAFKSQCDTASERHKEACEAADEIRDRDAENKGTLYTAEIKDAEAAGKKLSLAVVTAEVPCAVTPTNAIVVSIPAPPKPTKVPTLPPQTGTCTSGTPKTCEAAICDALNKAKTAYDDALKKLEAKIKEWQGKLDQCKQAEQSCTALQGKQIQSSGGLFPRTAAADCFINNGKEPNKKGDSEKALAKAQEYETKWKIEGASADFMTQLKGLGGSAKIQAALAEPYGCTALCEPKPMCVEQSISGNQRREFRRQGLMINCELMDKGTVDSLAGTVKGDANAKNPPYSQLASYTGEKSCNGLKMPFTPGDFGGPEGFQKPYPEPSPSPSAGSEGTGGSGNTGSTSGTGGSGTAGEGSTGGGTSGAGGTGGTTGGTGGGTTPTQTDEITIAWKTSSAAPTASKDKIIIGKTTTLKVTSDKACAFTITVGAQTSTAQVAANTQTSITATVPSGTTLGLEVQYECKDAAAKVFSGKLTAATS